MKTLISQSRIALAALAVTVILAGMLGGCGAAPPPTEGTCHPWREWVPPAEDEDGDMQDGYCRDARER